MMKLPEDDVLFKTSKEELERIKLALEISTFQEDRRQVRRKSWGETTRLVIMAVFAAALSLGSTYIMKIYDHDTTQLDEALKDLTTLKKKYASTHITLVKDSVACEIGQIYIPGNNPKLENEVSYYRNICQNKTKQDASTSVKKDSIEKIVSHYDRSSPNGVVVDKKLSQNDAQLMRLQVQVNSKNGAIQENAQKQIDALTKVSTDAAPPQLKSAIESSTEINKTVVDQIAEVSSQPSTEHRDKVYPVYWVKTGYYILFDQFRISLNDLNPRQGTAQVKICFVTEENTCEPISLPNQGSFSTQQPLDFDYKGKSYSLVLQRIDHAGVNPFKQAAYINLIQKEK